MNKYVVGRQELIGRTAWGVYLRGELVEGSFLTRAQALRAARWWNEVRGWSAGGVADLQRG